MNVNNTSVGNVTIRMTDGHTREADRKCRLKSQIEMLEVELEAVVLKELIADILIGHEFLVKQQVAWDYSAATIHLGAEKQTTVCWRKLKFLTAGKPDLSEIEFLNGPDGENLREVLEKYPSIFNNCVRRTRIVEHEIRLNNTKPVALNSYPYSKEKTELISQMLRDIEGQGLVEPSISHGRLRSY